MAKTLQYGDDTERSVRWMEVELGLDSQAEVFERALVFFKYIIENRKKDNDSILVGPTNEQLKRLYLKQVKQT